MIDPQEVAEAFEISCWSERLDGVPGTLDDLPEGSTHVEGVAGQYLFNEKRLERYRSEIIKWLNDLPDNFHKDKGGGWSFLNACNTRDGDLWTGFHERMDQLFAMAFGLKLAQFLMPRNMWMMFPGGMPYIVVDTVIGPTRDSVTMP